MTRITKSGIFSHTTTLHPMHMRSTGELEVFFIHWLMEPRIVRCADIFTLSISSLILGFFVFDLQFEDIVLNLLSNFFCGSKGKLLENPSFAIFSSFVCHVSDIRSTIGWHGDTLISDFCWCLTFRWETQFM